MGKRGSNMRRIVLAVSALAGAAAVSAALAVAAPPSKLTICHKTGSGAFQRISISSRAVTKPTSAAGKSLGAALRRAGDAVVVGTGACPSASVTGQPSATPQSKVTICHKTGSRSNPYRRIVVSSRAWTNANSRSGRVLRGHMRHTGDILMAGSLACPSGTTGGGGGGQNQGIKLTANLQPAPPATTGSGTATVTIQLGQGQLCYTLSVSGLTNVTAAHIHRTSSGAVVVPLTAPTSGTSSGCVSVEKSLLQEIASNPSAFYVNVHTASFPNGQIRGTLTK